MTFLAKVLVAVDDAVPSQYAIAAGLSIARADGAALVFAVVLDASLRTEDCSFASSRELAERIAADILAGACARAAQLNVPATSQVIFDEPVRGIVGLAEFEGAGMIVMGAPVRRGIVRSITGTVAEGILQQTDTPICIVRKPPPSADYHRLLVPVVEDDLSSYAIEYAVHAARSLGSRLLFCTIDNDAGPETKRYLEGAKKRASASGVMSDWIVVPQDGRVAALILEQSRIEACDAIIMASHRRDGLARLLQSSVARTVVRSSDVPVVVLRSGEAPYTAV